MKTFDYIWTSDYYLLHLQFNFEGTDPLTARVERHYTGARPRAEDISAHAGAKSHRILISRSHPRETSFTVSYPEHVTLEVYQLDDRAYYPTEAHFVG